MSPLFLQVSPLHLLPGYSGGERCSQCTVVPLSNTSNHRRLCSSSPLRHFQLFPNRSGVHADVLCFFPSQRASLWAFIKRPRTRLGPICSVLHITFWGCDQLTAFQPRRHHHHHYRYHYPGAWHWEIFGAGWLHASVSGATQGAIHIVVACSTTRRDGRQNWPM